ncbi:MAG: hypothetical protein JXR68_05135 [Bacteroidales bacterium]|nr:hypothetical protein [Bacteroidales bacterium]
MKNIALILAILLFGVFIGFSQQSKFDYFLKGNVGTKSVLGVYTGSGSKLGKQTFEITEVSDVNDTAFVKIKSHLSGMGTLITNYYVKYYDSVSYLDLINFIDVANFYNNKVITLNPIWLPYPANMKVGDSLQGYSMVRDYGNSVITTDMVDRVVAAKDTITVTAGDFECLKITYRIVAKTPGGTFITGYTDWINKDVGLVRQESTTGSGRLENYFELETVQVQ